MHDDFVTWLAESGAGSWESFKTTYDWLIARSTTGNHVPAYGYAHELSALGYLEINWSDGRWSAAPPVVTLVPAAGGYGLIIGARTRTLDDRIERETSEDVTLGAMILRVPQSGAPSALFVEGDESEVEALGKRLGIPYEVSVPERLSLLLPPLRSAVELKTEPPPPPGFEIRRWDPRSMLWQRASSAHRPGLMRIDAFGRPRTIFCHSHENEGLVYHTVDASTGFYAELARVNESVLRFRPDSVSGTLWTPLGARIPALQARAATLCTGLRPTVPNRDKPFAERRLRYDNVPRMIADRISKSLGQELDLLANRKAKR